MSPVLAGGFFTTRDTWQASSWFNKQIYLYGTVVVKNVIKDNDNIIKYLKCNKNILTYYVPQKLTNISLVIVYNNDLNIKILDISGTNNWVENYYLEVYLWNRV